MSGLPTDVWEVADEAVSAISKSMWLDDGERQIPWGAARMAIGNAILVERKRCARVAMSNAHTDCEVAEQIAAMIEAGQ